MRISISPIYFLPIAATLLLAAAPAAFAVKVADITRISGARTNLLIGQGLIVGLKGSGDGGAFMPAIKPLAALLSKFADPTAVTDLANAANVAIVEVTAHVPPDGARNGDHLDVFVTSVGAAPSLRGGRLFVTPMLGPTGQPFVGVDAEGNPTRPIPFALAEGAVITEDPTTPTVGVVKGGAVMEVDLPARYVDNAGRFTLVIDDPSAGWTMSSTIAKLINEANDSGENVAVAVDPKNVVVTIPPGERERPDSFISAVLRLPVPLLPTAARVQINDRTGTMIVTGDVEISPVVISHKGLTITTVNPAPVPGPRNPIVSTRDVVQLDTTNGGGARLQDLAAAFDQLKVPADDRITIVKELYGTGKLHAKLYIDGGGAMSGAILQNTTTAAATATALTAMAARATAGPAGRQPHQSHDELVTQTQKWVAQTFYGTLLRQMRKSPWKDEKFSGGRGGEVFGEMLDQKLADHMSRSSGDKLVNSLVRKMEGARAYAEHAKAEKQGKTRQAGQRRSGQRRPT